jgi:acyl dehydratase
VGPPPVGARIAHDLLLDAAAIKAGARAIGDMNPLHHDEAFAAASRFGELIASGAHTGALLVGMLGSAFGNDSTEGSGLVGVDYSVQFRAPVRVNRAMRMEWEVAAVEPRRKGAIVRMDGRIVDAETAAPALIAKLTMLYLG